MAGEKKETVAKCADDVERRKKERNKNTNRNKEGFAFDKHRKKAPRKVITYTHPRTATAYASLFQPFEIPRLP